MIDCRQFAICKKEYRAHDFKNIRLKNGYFFSYQENLNFYIDDERRTILIGYAWQINNNINTPEKEIVRLLKEYEGDELHEMIIRAEEHWCGRYILVVDSRIYLDASGLLGIFYSSEGVSSSCTLLAKIMGKKTVYFTGINCRMNWMPAPNTQYKGIFRLLPSQIYDIDSGKITARSLIKNVEEKYESVDELVAEFVRLFSCSLNNMLKLFPNYKVLVTLTGGHDSRTVLALAHKANLDLTCVTLEHDGMSVDDREIPVKICKRENIPFEFISRRKTNCSINRAIEYETHTGGMANDADKQFYIYGQYQELIEKYHKVLLLRGHVWEIVTEFYRKYIDDVPVEIMYEQFGGYNNSVAMDSLKQFTEWVRAHNEYNIPMSDRFLWEQRVGCWMSSIEQGFDMIEDMVSIHPVNSRTFLSMLYLFPQKARICKKHQEWIIDYSFNELSNYDYEKDKKKNMFSATIRGIERLYYIGPAKTVRYYISLKKGIKTKSHQL